MGLRAKFNLVVLVACIAGFLVGAVVFDRLFLDAARNQVTQNARIMMTEADAIRRYTAEKLVPLLPLEHEGKFVPETVPAYAAQTNFKELQTSFPGYSYREPALNPTNLSDRAQDWEADVINEFRNNPAKDELVVQRDTPTGVTLNLLRPVVIKETACLLCHNTPAEAPAALKQTYGSANGFGWKLNEVVAAQIVTVPMTAALKLGHEAYVTFLMIMAAIFVLIFLILNVLLHFLVISPVKKVSAMADAISLGNEEVEAYVKPGKDEISLLSFSFNRMRESLRHAMAMLHS